MRKRIYLRLFSLILTLALVFSGLSFSARAEESFRQWKQADPRWNRQEAWPQEDFPQADFRTVKEGGDQLLSLSMLLKQYEIVKEAEFTPLHCLEALKKGNAFDEEGRLLWFRIEEVFPGFRFENRVDYSFQKVSALYGYGHPCMLALKGKDGLSRYVAVESVSADTNIVRILDPGSETTKLADPSQVEAIYYFSTGPQTDGPEYAKFPAPVMEVTQLAYESFSHGISNAIDIIPHGDLIAPFRCTVTFTDPSWGYVVLQSTGKVLYADGTLDYMTVSMVHSEDIDEMIQAQKEGRIICQGEPIYRAGGMGRWDPDAFLEHVHLAAYRGHVSGVTEDGFYGCGDIYPYDAFLIDPMFTTSYYGRGEGYKSTDSFMYHKAPADYRGFWKTAGASGNDPSETSETSQ